MILSLPAAAAVLLGWLIASQNETVVAVFLVSPVAVLSHLLTIWLGSRWPMGAFIGMAAGTIARATVMVAGGLLAVTQTDWFTGRGVALWFWMIGIYLSTLVCELALWLVPAMESRGSGHVGSR